MIRQRISHLILTAAMALAIAVPSAAFAQSDSAPDELFKLGNEAFTAGKVDEAIGHYKQCVEKRPKFKEAWYNLGIAYSTKKQHEKEQ